MAIRAESPDFDGQCEKEEARLRVDQHCRALVRIK